MTRLTSKSAGRERGPNAVPGPPGDSPSPAYDVLVWCVLPVLSGAGALILEVLWMKELGVLFGNTAHAAGATLFVFFLGLGIGGLFWGRRCRRAERPLRLYGLLELGVAGSALAFFGLIALYRQAYAPIFDGLDPGAALVAKIVLACAILLPPAVLMGGTLPVLAERVARTAHRLPRLGSLLYAFNTAGAAVGVLLAGFVLPQQFGFRGAYLVAIVILSAVGMSALLIDRMAPDPAPRPAAMPTSAARAPWRGPANGMLFIPALSFLSGFLSLGLQVLWTRLLAQVLNNSTYAFSAILVTYLAAMAISGFLVALAMQRGLTPFTLIGWALGLSGIAVLASSAALVQLTDGLSVLAVGPDWPHFLGSIFLACATLMLVPVILMGTVLPALLGGLTDGGRRPGEILGRLLAVNAFGAMSGAILSGFVLLSALGYWGSLRLLAVVYLTLGAAVLFATRTTPRFMRLAGGAVFLLVSITGIPGARPVLKLGAGERLVDVIEGSAGTVTVTRIGENLIMRLNNSYVLGDSRSVEVERLQARLPLLLHPAPSSVFFLGMGTGSTAAAALDHPVSRVVVAELLPEVAHAARTHFGRVTAGLFVDPRVRIVIDDGRTYLAGTRERYDVIISDLFTPWHAGTASLYSVEHFRTVRERLATGGFFVQWLPLHQMSQRELLIIARTMQEIFPQVTLWRGNFSATQPIVALLARSDDVPLDHAALLSNVSRVGGRAFGVAAGEDVMAGLFYAGNLAGLRAELDSLPRNTDDRPVIEYLAPRARAEGGQGFVGVELERFFERLLARTPPGRDPFLSRFPASELRYVPAGLEFYRYHAYLARNQADSARTALARFRSQALIR